MARESKVARKTGETSVKVRMVLDGSGEYEVRTPVPFLNHMLELFARHGLFDLALTAQGDTDVDDHHTVEDVGICLGKAMNRALGDKAGIRRFGHASVPMDETLAEAAVDISGRPHLTLLAELPKGKVGAFDLELTREFFQALANHLKATLHLRVHYGENLHHIVEALFKAAARALDQATALDPRVRSVPSTKGTLE